MNRTPDFKFAVIVILLLLASSLLVSAAAPFLPISDSEGYMLFAAVSTMVVIVAIAAAAITRFKRHMVHLLKTPFSYLLKGFLFYLASIPLVLLIMYVSFVLFRAAGISPIPQQLISYYLSSDSFLVLSILVFLSCIVAPLAEEIIFRAVIYEGLKKAFPIVPALILGALIFALLHNELFSLGALFALGAILAFVYEKSGNLWPSIWMHFFNNLFANLAVFALRYTDFINILEGW